MANGADSKQNQRMTVEGAISKGWNTFINNVATFVALSVLPTTAFALLNLLFVEGYRLGDALNNPFGVLGAAGAAGIGVILLVLLVIVSIWFQAAIIKTALLDLGSKETDQIGFSEALEKSRPQVGHYFLVSLAFGLVVALGLLLLIIPGIYFLIIFGLSVYIAIDRPELGVQETLKQSKSLVEKDWSLVIGAGLVLLLINIIAGVLPGGDYINAALGGFYASVFALVYLELKSRQD